MSDSVGIKMLKENLSQYIARAREGERIIVTDRGQEVAELGPVSPERSAILQLVASGAAQWSGHRFHVEGPPLDVPIDLSGAVLEDRR